VVSSNPQKVRRSKAALSPCGRRAQIFHRPYNLYCVGGDVTPCSINQSYPDKVRCQYQTILDLRHYTTT